MTKLPTTPAEIEAHIDGLYEQLFARQAKAHAARDAYRAADVAWQAEQTEANRWARFDAQTRVDYHDSASAEIDDDITYWQNQQELVESAA